MIPIRAYVAPTVAARPPDELAAPLHADPRRQSVSDACRTRWRWPSKTTWTWRSIVTVRCWRDRRSNAPRPAARCAACRAGARRSTASIAGVGVNGSRRSARAGRRRRRRRRRQRRQRHHSAGRRHHARTSTRCCRAPRSFSHQTQPQANTVVEPDHRAGRSVTHHQQRSCSRARSAAATSGSAAIEQYFTRTRPVERAESRSSAPRMEIVLRQNLLQGFGVALNNRGIRIAEINRAAARETFRSQLLDLVVTVLNTVLGLRRRAGDELKVARARARASRRSSCEDTKYEISVGALAWVELPRAQAEVASRQQDVVIAQATVRQRAILLKEALSHTRRSGARSRRDHSDRPHRSCRRRTRLCRRLRDMVKRALAKRPDVAVAKYPRPDRRNESGRHRRIRCCRASSSRSTPTIAARRDAADRAAASPIVLRRRLRHGAGTGVPPQFPERDPDALVLRPIRQPAGAGRLRHRPVAVPAIAASAASATRTRSWWTFRARCRRCSQARVAVCQRAGTRAVCRSNCWRRSRRSPTARRPTTSSWWTSAR